MMNRVLGILLPLLACADVFADPKSLSNLIVAPTEQRALEGEAGEYVIPEDGLISFQLPDQVSYGGLIIANGGLIGTKDSFLSRNYGLTLKMWIGENEDYGIFHRGEHVGLFTSADYLAIYGKELNASVVAPAVFYSFDDFLIVRRRIASVDELVGETLAVPQHTIADFFIRNVLRRNGLKFHQLKSYDSTPLMDAVNFMFTVQVDEAAKVFDADLQSGKNVVAGCCAWDPMNQEVVQNSSGFAHYLTDRQTKTVAADILLFNKTFLQKNPRLGRGLVHGLLHGNNIINQIKSGEIKTSPGSYGDQILELIAVALTDGRPDAYTKEEVRGIMDVHDFANYATMRAYFEAQLEGGMSFEDHFRSAASVFNFGKARGDEFGHLMDDRFLKELGEEAEFARARYELASPAKYVEARPDWVPTEVSFSKRKLSEINLKNVDNQIALQQTIDYLRWNETSMAKISGYLSASSGSQNAVAPENLIAMSKKRAEALKALLVSRGVGEDRIETAGLGRAVSGDGKARIEMIDLE